MGVIEYCLAIQRKSERVIQKNNLYNIVKYKGNFMKRMFIVIICFFGIISCSKDDTPNWVKKTPAETKTAVYFVGKSERMENYENYLEAKVDALMDVLMQFSIYKGAEVESQARRNDEDESNTSLSIMTKIKIRVSDNSAGLYQQAEWMAKDSTLYVLYSLPKVEAKSMPNLSGFFKNFQLKDDKIYFTAMAVSPHTIEELPAVAEQNAKMQALLYLGSDINAIFNDYMGESGEIHNTQSLESIEAVLECVSQISLENLSFREEAHYIQEVQDKKYYYGLYSMDIAKPKDNPEYSIFRYYARVAGESSALFFIEEINFNGNIFTRNTPHTVINRSGINSDGIIGAEGIPQPKWVNNPPKETKKTIYFIGKGRNVGSAIMNKVTATTNGAKQFAEWTSRKIKDYVEESEKTDNVQSLTIFKEISSISKAKTSSLKQENSWVVPDESYSILFSYSKDAFKDDLKKEFKKDFNEKTFKHIDEAKSVPAEFYSLIKKYLNTWMKP